MGMNRISLFVSCLGMGSCLFSSATAGHGQGREMKTPYYSLALTAGRHIDCIVVCGFAGQRGVPTQRAVCAGCEAAVSVNTTVNPAWQFPFSAQSFQMINTYRAGVPGQPMVLRFDPEQTHATLLTYVDGGQARLPALLHLPEQGSLRVEVESRQPVLLGYAAHRRGKAFVDVMFPGATLENPRVAVHLHGGRYLSAFGRRCCRPAL